MSKQNTVKEPLFHIVKRTEMPLWQAWLIRIVAIIVGLAVASVLCAAVAGKNPLDVPVSLINGCFGTERRLWVFLREGALLLGVTLALIPAFKMKFWNLGGNGQVLIGCIASTACMFYLGGKLPDWVVNIIMIVAAIAAGAIWAVIPAIFKACFNTNETLFTLMMNYITTALAAYCLVVWVPSGTSVLSPFTEGVLPTIINDNVLTLIVVAVLLVFMTVYLKFSKHGYELSVVGESEKTAKYIGINVKRVVIRTLVLSGAICGVIGLLLSGSINHTLTTSMDNNMGFTATMTAWLAKFSPLVAIFTSFFITFISRGMSEVQVSFGFSESSVANIVTGLVYFAIIACEFFVSYKIVGRSKNKEKSVKTETKEKQSEAKADEQTVSDEKNPVKEEVK